jgi:tetratricopeptide (TPR) repeat protein
MTAERPPLPDSYEGILQHARSARDAGQVEEAIALYRRLADRLGRLSDRIRMRRPDLGEMELQVWLELADLLQQEGRYAEAIEVKKVLLAMHPDQADTWRHDLAILRIAKGEVEPGLAELRALIEEKPDDIWRWVWLGIETRIEGRFVDSQAALDQALEVGSEDDPKALAFAHYQRFHLFKEMGHLDQAVASWEQAAAHDPVVLMLVQEVYAMFTAVGRYSEALHYVDRDANEIQAGFQRGLIASLTGDTSRAREEWQSVAGMNPTDFEYGYESWVEAVLRLGDPQPVLDRIQELMMRFGTPRLVVLAGIAWAMQGNMRPATLYLQHATTLLRRGRPPKQKLDSADWHLLDSLVADDRIKAELRSYFAVLETLWDRSTTGSRKGEGLALPPLRT